MRRPSLTDQDDELLASRDARIKQIPLQHHDGNHRIGVRASPPHRRRRNSKGTTD